MAKLSYHQKKHLRSSQYLVPELKKLPVPDASHVRNAAARLNQTHLSTKYLAEARRNLQRMRKHFHIGEFK